MDEKIRIDIPVIVEGKYDKIKLSSVIDAKIVTTDGFGLFRSEEKKCLLKRISENGVIVLTDSDGAGKVIRARLSGMIAPDKIYNLYTPRIEGKEKRKAKRSKEGVLGVEGMDADTVRGIFRDFIKNNGASGKRGSFSEITKTDFFECSLTGADNSREMRDAFCKNEGLPTGMTPNALLAAVNIIMTKEEFLIAARKITERGDDT